MKNDPKKIRITWDDIDKAEDPISNTASHEEKKTWGTVSDNPILGMTSKTSGGSILLKGWFYLGLAGFIGAFLAWMICEPSFEDNYLNPGWGNVMIFPLMAILMCICLGTVESIVERSWKRTLSRGLSSIGLGLVLGFIFHLIANILFNIFLKLLINSGADYRTIDSNPLLWLFRGIAWASFGIAGGLIFGIVSKSGKKTSFGMLGGVIGGFIGGFFFDPISLVTNLYGVSRAIGMSILGASTGIAIGIVESALKERWLYVNSGPLAGKQFVLYQDFVTIGKAQNSIIYLFKDQSILEQHAMIVRRAGRSVINAFGPVVISGQMYQGQKQKVLCTSDILQIGRYTFTYAEKEK